MNTKQRQIVVRVEAFLRWRDKATSHHPHEHADAAHVGNNARAFRAMRNSSQYGGA